MWECLEAGAREDPWGRQGLAVSGLHVEPRSEVLGAGVSFGWCWRPGTGRFLLVRNRVFSRVIDGLDAVCVCVAMCLCVFW